MISFKEYDALKAYMEPKLFELWEHENKIRKEKGLEELNSFQVGFPINEIYHYYVDGDHNFYIVFNVSCHRLLQEGILEALEAFPEKFGTGNAMDVIDALYEGSVFKSLGDKERYIQFLAENACCYVVYANGEEFGDILRLDTFRYVEEKKNNPNVYDFTGGLMHVLKHFSHEGRNLAVGKDVHDLFDLGHLDLLLSQITDDLMSILGLVLATADMNPVITTVGCFHNELIEVGVMLEEVEPLLGDVHISMLTVVVP